MTKISATRSDKNRLAVVALTEKGARLGLEISKITGACLHLPEHLKDKTAPITAEIVFFKYPLSNVTKEIFFNYRNIVFVMALGIVVREVSLFLKNKYNDPAVVTVDEGANFAVSTLSGHEGKANNLAKEIAKIVGATPVITTASEVNKKISLGIGCRKNTPKEKIEKAILSCVYEKNLTVRNIAAVATIDLKKNEDGLLRTCKKFNLPIKFYSKDELKRVAELFEQSCFIEEKVGVGAVCEPSAYLASNGGTLILKKQNFDGISIAVAELTERNKEKTVPPRRGKLYIVGIGPGDLEDLSVRARSAILESTAVVGYRAYIETIKPLLNDKKIYSYPMTKEVERCKKAIELAKKDEVVSFVSSGDPGIYGMAGLLLEVIPQKNDIDISIIPGISSLNFSASLLGAPLMNDFAVISLSDVLTPWHLIEQKIKSAATGDFVIVFLNPGSKKRISHLKKALEIVSAYRPKTTPTGIVEKMHKNSSCTENYRVKIKKIKELMTQTVNMNTTVIVGNSQTFVKDGKLITKRGYNLK